jgi:iron(III) transport system ATP-binding protein
MTYLSLQHLIKRFPARGGSGEVLAVDDVNLDIQQGEFVTLLGPSGCGKTTTLRLIAGFEFPTSGEIILDGSNVASLPPDKRQMSMVFQSYAIFPHLSVYENISYGLKIKKLSKQDINTRTGNVLELTELTGLENRAPNQLSGGQQQRVALARALVMEPKVLLLDEPLSNLDAKLREQMRIELRRIQHQLGITSVYVTHDQVEAMSLSDRIVVMNEGKIEQVGPPREVYRTPATEFVANFIGRANFVDGEVISVDGDKLLVEALGGQVLVNMPRQSRELGHEVRLVLRPETIRLDATEGVFPATVLRSTYLGSEVEYEIEVAGQTLIVEETDLRRSKVFGEGQSVMAGFWEDALYCLPKLS